MIFFQYGEKMTVHTLHVPGLGMVTDFSQDPEGFLIKTWMGFVRVTRRDVDTLEEAIQLFINTVETHNMRMSGPDCRIINGYLKADNRGIAGLGAIKEEKVYNERHPNLMVPKWKRFECQMGYVDIPL